MLIRTGSEDRTSFQEVYRLTNAKLFGICLRICGNKEAAEDVLHEVYLLIWRRAGAWEPGRASPITWMATIARNRAIDWCRAQGIRATAPIESADLIADSHPDAEAAAISRDLYRRLIGCLEGLDTRARGAITTAFFDGVTYADLATRADVPLGTMKSWVRRGLVRLKECLGHD